MLLASEEIISVCLRAEKSLYDKYTYWLASTCSQVTSTAIGCSEQEICPVYIMIECGTGWRVFAALECVPS